MAMYWAHNSSEQWMKSRLQFLTASEVVSLTKSYLRAEKAGKIGDGVIPEFAKLWLDKNVDKKYETFSNGAAARGHIMEPYAIDEWNDNMEHKMFHWDDFLVHDTVMAFSPDALDIPQPDGFVSNSDNIGGKPSAMVEVKSYGGDHHRKIVFAKNDGSELADQRMQIAVGMLVCPSIEKGFLLAYNPSMDPHVAIHEWTRDELENEIAMADKIREEWKSTCRLMIDEMDNVKDPWPIKYTEKEIWQNTMPARF